MKKFVEQGAKVIVLAGALLPVLASAQIRNTDDLTFWLVGALIMASRLIVAAAVVYFLWGVFKFVKSAGDEKAQEEGKQHMIYGIIGIAVMVSVWGLVNFLTSSARLDPYAQKAPEIRF